MKKKYDKSKKAKFLTFKKNVKIIKHNDLLKLKKKQIKILKIKGFVYMSKQMIDNKK